MVCEWTLALTHRQRHNITLNTHTLLGLAVAMGRKWDDIQRLVKGVTLILEKSIEQRCVELCGGGILEKARE